MVGLLRQTNTRNSKNGKNRYFHPDTPLSGSSARLLYVAADQGSKKALVKAGETLMRKELSRSSVNKIGHQLWGRAAGRCEFNGCNRPLYKSPVTQEQGNISEVAHIWSFSENGPRGWGPFATKKALLNDLPNLMLLCHDCHKIIDADKKGIRYPADLLLKWKDEHERRVAVVCGINPEKKSNIILYGANIGDQLSMLQPEHAKAALFPHMYPAEERPVQLSMNWEGKDDKEQYWATESKNLTDAYNRQIRPLLESSMTEHYSIFALAPIPLLIQLGALFTDKVSADVYQLRREPCKTWEWSTGPTPLNLIINRPTDFSKPPALLISLSDGIAHDRVWSVIGKDVAIWELTIDQPGNDFLKSKDQLSTYRTAIRQVIAEIGQKHGLTTPLSVFPAMPVACAVELGRVRMPKAVMPWIIYDQNSKRNSFVRAVELGGNHE